MASNRKSFSNLQVIVIFVLVMGFLFSLTVSTMGSIKDLETRQVKVRDELSVGLAGLTGVDAGVFRTSMRDCAGFTSLAVCVDRFEARSLTAEEKAYRTEIARSIEASLSGSKVSAGKEEV